MSGQRLVRTKDGYTEWEYLMSTFTYAVCRKCKRVLDLDKFLTYAGDQEDNEHYRIREKQDVLLAWIEGHATCSISTYGVCVVTEYDDLMDECRQDGWTFVEWNTGEERVWKVPERFKR